MDSASNKNETSEIKKLQFIPLDLEQDLELAMNESLPEVLPMDDDDDDEDHVGELENIYDFENNSAASILEMENPKEMILDETLGCHSNFKTPIKGQVIYTSLPSETSKKIENKRLTDYSDLGIGKLSLYTPVKTEVETISLTNKCTSQLSQKEKKFSDMFRTPIQPASLLKPREPASTSKIPQGYISDIEFPKLRIRGTTYLIMKVLGKGGSSEVYQCFDYFAKVNRAIKCVNLDSPSSEGFLKEVDCLRKLQKFDRIIRLYDYEHLKKEKKLYVVMEMGTTDLSKILRNASSNSKEMSPPYLILFYWMEMLRAVRQIHAYGVIHSDLKPANFLLVDGKLKLIDFGISCSLQNDSTSVIKTVSEGTSNYISPEALNCEYSSSVTSPNYGKPKYKISVKADVWSLGCILYQLVYKKTPFHEITNPMQKLMAIANPNLTIKYPRDYAVPQKFIKTIKKCLIFDAKSRASVVDLIAEYEHFDSV
ncbi:dual specificity protein kinase TTK [Harmonia axyridis]|uniref:dual specificity protein kinase TTK n=1 Tax=Harmonia axyridis TaxID=115357 RepID=UPI001E275082|nr:dual specificity protein kinase TTK [Harmonia axyridis]